MLSPLVLLNGDAYDFGVVIINETQNLREIEKLSIIAIIRKWISRSCHPIAWVIECVHVNVPVWRVGFSVLY